MLGSFRAALDAAAELPGALQDRVTAKGCYSELPQLLLDAGAKGAALAAVRQDTAHEVLMDEGDLCVFDPMLSPQGSPFRAPALPGWRLWPEGFSSGGLPSGGLLTVPSFVACNSSCPSL